MANSTNLFKNSLSNKDLNDAKEKSRQLEKQLSEALAKGNNNIWMIVAVIAIIVTVLLLIFK